MRRNLDPTPKLQRTKLTVATLNRIQEYRKAEETRAGRTRNAPQASDDQILRRLARNDWKARWEKKASQYRGPHPPTTWTAPWTQDCRKLYAGLSKAQATALFLMRTEVISFNAWLASVRVPDV